MTPGKISLESKKEDFIRGQSLRTGYNTIYSDPSTAHYLYFSTKQKHIFYNAELRDENSLLFVNDIWQADIVEINKKFPTRRRERRETNVERGEDESRSGDPCCRFEGN